MNKISLLIISGMFCIPVFFYEKHPVQIVTEHSNVNDHLIGLSSPKVGTASSVCVQYHIKPIDPAFQSPDIKASIARGEKIYHAGCISCHQVNGTGVPGMNPPLKATSYVKGDKQVLINIVLNGIKEKDIDDESYSNSMPSQRQLTDQNIADVLTYVRSSFGNKSSAVLSSEVKAIREK